MGDCMSFHDALPPEVKRDLDEDRDNFYGRALASSFTEDERRAVVNERTKTPERTTDDERAPRREFETLTEYFAGQDPDQPARFGFRCYHCKRPVDSQGRGAHPDDCPALYFNDGTVQGQELFTRLLRKHKRDRRPS
jgi:hypothetical protein